MGFTIESSILKRYTEEPGVTRVTIPEGVVHIGEKAFEGCTQITSVTIPHGVRSIGDGAFSGCTSLRRVVLPVSITRVGKWVIGKRAKLICQGITFTNEREGSLKSIIHLIRSRYYETRMSLVVKYPILWKMFRQEADAELMTYIRKHFKKMFQYALEHNDMDTVKAVCKYEDLLTAKNIDRFIEYALTHKQTENYLMLLNYKNEKLGFGPKPLKL